MPAMGPKLRCITLNLKGMSSEWFELRFAMLVRGLAKLEADLICFQECTVAYRESRLYDQARSIGKAIGFPVSVFAPYGNPVEVMSRQRGGVALISRCPILEVRIRRLCSGHERHDARVGLFATLLPPGGPVELGTAHLSWKSDEAEVRLMQAGMILEELLASEGSNRKLLLGDLNGTEDEPAIRLINEDLRDAYRAEHPLDPGFTWDSRNPLAAQIGIPDRRVDYIFCSRNTLIRKCEVVLREEVISDHYGVLADLEWSS